MAFHGYDPGDPNKWYQSRSNLREPAAEYVGNYYSSSFLDTGFHGYSPSIPNHHFQSPHHWVSSPNPVSEIYPDLSFHHHSSPPLPHHTIINGHSLPLQFPFSSQISQPMNHQPSPSTYYPHSQPYNPYVCLPTQEFQAQPSIFPTKATTTPPIYQPSPVPLHDLLKPTETNLIDQVTYNQFLYASLQFEDTKVATSADKSSSRDEHTAELGQDLRLVDDIGKVRHGGQHYEPEIISATPIHMEPCLQIPYPKANGAISMCDLTPSLAFTTSKGHTNIVSEQTSSSIKESTQGVCENAAEDSEAVDLNLSYKITSTVVDKPLDDIFTMECTKPLDILHRYALFDDIATKDVSKEEFLHVFIALVSASCKLCPLEVRKNFLWNMFKPKLTAMIISYSPLVNVKLGKANFSMSDKIEELKQNIVRLFERMWEHWTLKLTVENSLDDLGTKELNVEFLTKSMDFLENLVVSSIDLIKDKDALWSAQYQIVCSSLPIASWHGNGVLTTERSLAHIKKGLLLSGKAIVKGIKAVFGWFLSAMLELGTVSTLNAWFTSTFICAPLTAKWGKMSLLIVCWFEKLEGNVNFFEEYMEPNEKCLGSAMLGVGVTVWIWDALQLFDDMQKWGLSLSVLGSFYNNNKHDGDQRDFNALWSTAYVFLTRFPQLQITAMVSGIAGHLCSLLTLVVSSESVLVAGPALRKVARSISIILTFGAQSMVDQVYMALVYDEGHQLSSVVRLTLFMEGFPQNLPPDKMKRIATQRITNYCPFIANFDEQLMSSLDCGIFWAPVFALSASLLEQSFNLCNRNSKLSNVMTQGKATMRFLVANLVLGLFTWLNGHLRVNLESLVHDIVVLTCMAITHYYSHIIAGIQVGSWLQFLQIEEFWFIDDKRWTVSQSLMEEFKGIIVDKGAKSQLTIPLIIASKLDILKTTLVFHLPLYASERQRSHSLLHTLVLLSIHIHYHLIDFYMGVKDFTHIGFDDHLGNTKDFAGQELILSLKLQLCHGNLPTVRLALCLNQGAYSVLIMKYKLGMIRTNLEPTYAKVIKLNTLIQVIVPIARGENAEFLLHNAHFLVPGFSTYSQNYLNILIHVIAAIYSIKVIIVADAFGIFYLLTNGESNSIDIRWKSMLKVYYLCPIATQVSATVLLRTRASFLSWTLSSGCCKNRLTLAGVYADAFQNIFNKNAEYNLVVWHNIMVHNFFHGNYTNQWGITLFIYFGFVSPLSLYGCFWYNILGVAFDNTMTLKLLNIVDSTHGTSLKTLGLSFQGMRTCLKLRGQDC